MTKESPQEISPPLSWRFQWLGVVLPVRPKKYRLYDSPAATISARLARNRHVIDGQAGFVQSHWYHAVEGGRMRDPDETTASSRIPSKEIAQQGRDLYERDIRHQLEADHHGEIVAIDVTSGRWAVASDAMEAVDLLRKMEPDAVNILCEKVGYRGLSSFGGGSLERPR